MERIVERVEVPCPVGRIVERRFFVPADQIVERVIQFPFILAPCQEHVPVCDKIPVPQEVVSAQDVAVDANARVELEDSLSDAPADAFRTAPDANTDAVPTATASGLQAFGPEPPPGSYADPAGRTVVPIIPMIPIANLLPSTDRGHEKKKKKKKEKRKKKKKTGEVPSRVEADTWPPWVIPQTPPLTMQDLLPSTDIASAWCDVFAKYQQDPEYSMLDDPDCYIVSDHADS